MAGRRPDIGTGIGSSRRESVVATKYDGDEENSHNATAAHKPGDNPDRNLFLPEDPIADNATEKKQRDTDRDHDLSFRRSL
jgi:hypothetical protein